MKKFLITSFLLISSIIKSNADILPLLKYSISDLLIAGFDVIDVTAVNIDEVIYTLKMRNLDINLAKYPPLVMCIAKPQRNFVGCYDLR